MPLTSRSGGACEFFFRAEGGIRNGTVTRVQTCALPILRDLFEQAKQAAPAIIFIDELGAIGRARGGGPVMGGHDEREQTLNQILTEMDGFDPRTGEIGRASGRGKL